MELKQYQIECARTCPSLGSQEKDINHMFLGMDTELGELKDVFKKNLAYGKPIDWTNVHEEVGDLFWYLFNFCRINSIDPHQVMERNIQKLKTRYPEGFTHDKALNRDLTAERVKLEEKM